MNNDWKYTDAKWLFDLSCKFPFVWFIKISNRLIEIAMNMERYYEERDSHKREIIKLRADLDNPNNSWDEPLERIAFENRIEQLESENRKLRELLKGNSHEK